MALLVLGLNHRSAPVEVRERVAFGKDDLPAALGALRECRGVDEAIILSTCNRTEMYVGVDDVDNERPAHWLADWHGLEPGVVRPYLYAHPEARAVQHALRVASGLDSMVLGEPQILGQMKDAYGAAQNAGTSGKMLNRLFQHSFSVAKKVRSDTAIGASPVSVAFAAVRLAEQIFGELAGRTALVVGTGETIELVASHLVRNGLRRLVVASRSLERADLLAARFGGEGILIGDLPARLHEADIVVTATASRLPILGKGAVERAQRQRRYRPMFLVDLAVPRDMEPEIVEVSDVYLYTVDDLEAVVRDNMRAREQAALEAAEIIDSEVREFMGWRQSLDAVETIRELRARVEDARVQLVEKAHRQLTRGEDPHAVIEGLAQSLLNRLTHDPTVRIREAAQTGEEGIIQVARRLFGLRGGDPRQ